MQRLEFTFDDGGREAAGFRGQAGDCVVRAITIASGLPYKQVYDDLFERAKSQRKLKGNGSPRDGVPRKVYEKYLFEKGFLWVPCMGIGSGCTTHMRKDELPSSIIIVRLSRHLAAIKYGVLHDTYDCSRDGSRCVYGYYERGSL